MPQDNLNLSPLQEALERRKQPPSQHSDILDAVMDKLFSTGGLDRPLEPPHPAMFQGDPFINDPLVQQLYHRIVNKIPEVRNLSNNITVGPTPDILHRLENTKFKDYEFPQLNLMGVTNRKTKNISLNPSLVTSNRDFLLDTLTHELSHAAGAGETEAGDIGGDVADLNKTIEHSSRINPKRQ